MPVEPFRKPREGYSDKHADEPPLHHSQMIPFDMIQYNNTSHMNRLDLVAKPSFKVVLAIARTLASMLTKFEGFRMS